MHCSAIKEPSLLSDNEGTKGDNADYARKYREGLVSGVPVRVVWH